MANKADISTLEAGTVVLILMFADDPLIMSLAVTSLLDAWRDSEL